jgi:hypothetical protein
MKLQTSPNTKGPSRARRNKRAGQGSPPHELKRLDLELTATTISYSGTQYNVTASVAQGDGANERIGEEINLVKWELRCFARTNTAGSAPANDARVRVIVAYDKGYAATQQGPAAFNSGTATTYATESPPTFAYEDTIQILGDKIVLVDSAHPQALVHVGGTFPRSAMTHYASTTPIMGALSLLVYSETNTANDMPAFAGVFSLWYSDM